ncbi:helix-turn-helix transcriptional regulator [Streptomyces sp. NBC_01275]|uniref:helix-turn-helix transcriptional regulator n=1 Tax=Streptomyces sp. NBC_01275 TaxID=2903807 RepID=UPI00224E6178|nr:helix-turn-helix transcriptional regulator [Streptomyces sp. NBC_01275]MCX4763079.1 helix-turn-helix transcriptional regulator [Streptomyces sp. NBC_01275]
MNRRTELRAFLRSRRARLSPAEVGLPSFGGVRRVPGLRREELAQLAGVGVDYYVRLEQGRNHKVSAAVLDAVARALRLDELERVHLHNLARPDRPDRRQPRQPVADRVSEGSQWLLDNMPDTAAFVLGRRTQVLAWNRPAAKIFLDFGPVPERNLALLVYRQPAIRQLVLDWPVMARHVVAWLRLEVGRHPEGEETNAFIAELAAADPDFRRLWNEQNVVDPMHGSYRLQHPLLGALTSTFRTLLLPEDPDQMLIVYAIEPDVSGPEPGVAADVSWSPPPDHGPVLPGCCPDHDIAAFIVKGSGLT